MRKVLIAGLFAAIIPVAASLADSNNNSADTMPPSHEIEAKFVITIGGLKVGKLYFSATLDEGTYDSRVTLKAKGMAGLFVKANVDATTKGSHAQHAFQPVRYQRTQHKRKGPKTVKVDYSNGTPETIVFDPARARPLKYPVSEENRRDTLDPVTAILQIIAPSEGSPCDRSYEVFDGKKRYDFHLEPLEAGEEPMGPAPDGADNMIVCRAYYVRVDGFNPKDLKELPPPPIDGWFTKLEGGLYWKLERLATQTDFGVAILTTDRFIIREPDIKKAEVQ